ncbi:MAG: pyridoxamine 5'-phosphate oxidase family protein [Gemmataceae bacterium]
MAIPLPPALDGAQLVRRALEVIRAGRVCFLATDDAGQPRVRPVSPVRTDRFTAYVANLKSHNKTREIAANPKVELCFLDGKHDQVRVTGVAEVVTDAGVLQEFWGSPESMLLRAYLETIDSPQFVLYRVRPDRVRYMQEWAAEYLDVPLD